MESRVQTCFSGKLADLFTYLLGTLQQVTLALGRWIWSFLQRFGAALQINTCECPASQSVPQMHLHLTESRGKKSTLSYLGKWRAGGSEWWVISNVYRTNNYLGLVLEGSLYGFLERVFLPQLQLVRRWGSYCS